MGFSTTSAQPAVTVIDIDDVTVASEGMELLAQDAMLLQSTSLRAKRVIVRLDSAAVVYHSTNRRVRTRTSVHKGLLGYVTFGPQATGMVEGLQVRPGMMLVAEPETEAGFIVDAGWESITVLVPPEDIRRHLSARRREGEFRWPHRVETVRADPGRVQALFDWGKRLADTATRRPTLFDGGGSERRAVQVELLEALLATMRSMDKLEPSGKEQTRQARNHIVKIAEDYALSRAGEHTYISDLCRAAAVGERTLELAFKEIMGLSPVAYLTRLRLHRVRAALLAADQRSTKVSIEALKWGFWHFGEFSRAYRQCFGEVPSDTLRRRRVPEPVNSSE
jgi:AraC-like DNA-binding protein